MDDHVVSSGRSPHNREQIEAWPTGQHTEKGRNQATAMTQSRKMKLTPTCTQVLHNRRFSLRSRLQTCSTRRDPIETEHDISTPLGFGASSSRRLPGQADMSHVQRRRDLPFSWTLLQKYSKRCLTRTMHLAPRATVPAVDSEGPHPRHSRISSAFTQTRE